MKLCYLIIFFFISTVTCSQNPAIDSLQKVLKTQGEDTNKVKTLLRISDQYSKIGDPNSAIEYGKKALVLAEKINFTRGRFNAYNRIGGGYNALNNYPEALKFYYKSLPLAEESGEKVLVVSTLQNIGSIHSYLDNNEEALKYYIECLNIRQEMNDSAGLGVSYNSIGRVYIQTHNYPAALSYFKKALEIYQALGDRGSRSGLAWAYTCIADSHCYLGEVAEGAGKKTEAEKEYSEALKYSFIALEITQKLNNINSLVSSYHMIGIIYMDMKKYSLAGEYLEKSLQLAPAKPGEYSQIYLHLSTIDSARGDYQHAYQNYKLYLFYRDSFEGEERRKESVRIQMQYDFDKKEAATKAEQEKKDVITNTEIGKQKVVRNFSVAGAVAVLFFGGFAFYNFRKRKKLENQKALADERLRISRDLHDDMGASLSSISVFSSAVKQKLLNNETREAEQLLDRMSTDAQEMVSGMSEMVWTISPHNDTIGKLTDRLQLYASGMLSAKNISFSLECDEELKNKKLPVDMRKNIFLILKEGINNAAKYSCATEVKLTVSKKENRMVALLADNGKGFDISILATGNGLKNMHQRADEIQAQLEIISEINKGTSITLRVPTPQN